MYLSPLDGSGCREYGHLLILTYSHRWSWRWPFRRLVHYVRCADCDVKVAEP